MKKLSKALLNILAITGLLYVGDAAAQRSNCNAFIIGKRIEMGINWNGAIGASTAPPATSHANSSASLYNSSTCGGALYTGTSLGIIADPDEDGWATFFGDFILPGGAKEGWSIMLNNEQKNGWNSDAALSDTITDVTSYIYSYSDTGGKIEVKTQSVFNGIYTTQWITLDTAKLFFTVKALIENTSLATASDVFYMRMMNPHNDYTLSSSLNTWCKIENQSSTDTGHLAIVSAHGTVHNNAYVAMGAKDTRAQAFIARTGPLPVANTIDNISLGDAANFIYAANDSVNANTSIGLVYDLGTMVSGGYYSMNFFYAFRPDVIGDALSTTHLGVDDEIRHNVSHYHVYPNPISSTFKLMGIETADEVILFDMLGRRLQCDHTGANEFSTTDLAVGTYVVVIKDKTGIIKGRVQIQKI